MTLTPLIVLFCVNTGPIYDKACNAALEQGASQSGLAGKFENLTKQTEKDVIRYIDPSEEAEIAAMAFAYTFQLASGRQATFVVPNPGIKNSSISMGVGIEKTSLNFRIDF